MPFEIVPAGTQIDFLGKRQICLVISVGLIALGAIFAVVKGVNVGLDFAGGTEVQLLFDEGVAVDEEALRALTNEKGFTSVQVVRFSDDDAVNERYRDLIEARYLLGLRGPLGLDQTWVDAVNPQKSNLGRYINHGRPASLRKVRQRFPDRRLRFFAARDLEVGDELTFDYGDDYWIGREDELRE